MKKMSLYTHITAKHFIGFVLIGTNFHKKCYCKGIQNHIIEQIKKKEKDAQKDLQYKISLHEIYIFLKVTNQIHITSSYV